ncbi:hypothetical protein BDN72DRAFT_847572 [Pluteus cervinus]|uniref:Uncharacterized protein n=1 Tax=Pluteus cervinus TaxID=181527 RepID=A0ACD3AD09_9AGAR|nr:hypothetical protein BDN72DRAFT_847572 [Pluteus cervinus]
MHHPFTNAPKAKQAAIEKLDNDIRSLAERLRLLKLQRNSLSVTYTLPTEVLSKIFTITQIACRESFAYLLSHPFAETRTWLSMTHVSQHWRNVALECSELWCEIDLLPETAVRSFLLRSKRRGLEVYVKDKLSSRGQSAYSEGLLADIFAQTSRIQTLSIRGNEPFSQVLPLLTSRPAPQLKELTIFSTGDIMRFPENVDIFQGIVPQLDSLTLYRCRHVIPESALFVNNLTTLDIEDCPITSTTTWLKILQRMPSLSHLRLVDCFTNETEAVDATIPNDFGVISLPRLSHFSIRGFCFEEDLDFLAHTTFPSQTALDFSSCIPLHLFPNRQPLTAPLVAFLRVHNQSRQNLSDMQITGLTLEFDPGSALSLIVEREGHEHTLLSIKGLETVDCGEMLLAELTSLPLAFLTSFTTSCIINSRLEEVSVSGRAIQPLLRLLAGSGEFSDAGSDLDERTGADDEEDVEGVSEFEGGEDAEDQTDDLSGAHPHFEVLKSLRLYNTPSYMFKEALINTLEARRKVGFPVQQVRLSCCMPLMVDFLSRLQGLVDDVEFHESVYSQDDHRV